MSFGAFVLGFIALTIVAPIAIIGHYLTRWRAARNLSAEEENSIAQLWETAERLKTRVANLEKILDSEVPGWRTDHD